MARERLHKMLASAGVGSRRACEQVILEGRVRVNGVVRSELPILVDVQSDVILLDDRRVRPEPKVYYVLHKPKGVHCTNSDPKGRARAIDLVPDCPQRLYPVGRLDAASTGVLILTNDGDLAERLTHPRYGVAKTYLAEIKGRLTEAEVQKIKSGVWLSDGRTGRTRLRITKRGRDRSLIEITISEGKNRQIRRLLARVGHPVQKLTRIRIGPLTTRGLKPGNYRELRPAEVRQLRGLGKDAPVGAPGRPVRRRQADDS